MGKISNIMNHYLNDDRRFADLFNGVFFHGKRVVNETDLLEVSEVYHEAEAENMRTGERGERKERIRDVCKTLRSGEMLRVLALENQERIDYAMPFRCMQYDAMEYGKQLDVLRRQNQKSGVLKTEAEKFCGLQKADRITPVYTLCLYHGTERWDGPRSLWDMMKAGDGHDCFREIFNDYPLRLYCLNEAENMKLFRTEVRLLFQALQFRKNRTGLKQLIQNDPEYQQLDADTLEAMAVILELPSIWKNREKYLNQNESNVEEYNMCQAVREWAEEERYLGRVEGREEGRKEGREEGILMSIRNLMESTDMTMEQVMEALKLPEKDRGRYVIKLGQ